MSDEKYYQRVADELDGNPRKYTDKALWTKAEVLSQGDSEKTRYKYIELRVKKLNAQDIERATKENEKANLKNNLQEKRKEALKLEEKIMNRELTEEWVLWSLLIGSFFIARLFGLLGVASIWLGYAAYLKLNKEKNLTMSLLIAITVACISYVCGLILISFGLLGFLSS